MSKATAGRAAVLAAAILLVWAGAAPAQVRPVEELDLPRHVADEVVAFFNDSATLRFNGATRIPAGRVIVGDVGVLGGTLTVAGRIEGEVVVLNGNLRFEPGGRVDGDVTVVGGSAPEATADVAGTLTVYEDPLRYVERQGRIRVRGWPSEEEAAESDGFWGRSRFTVKNAGSYNRVEGLPVFFGPVFQQTGRNPFRAEALALWRTESGLNLDDDELGWLIRAEQRFDTEPALALGGTFHSRVVPINEHGLSDLEASLATFFFHKDYRDYYQRKGWSAFVRLGLDPGIPLDVTLELRDEEHRFAPVSSPWTLRKNDDPWRPQPLVGEGDIRTLQLSAAADSRNDPEDPTHGWFVRAALTHGRDGDLSIPERLLDGAALPPTPVDAVFTAAVVDARRYNRIGPDSELAFRLFYGGSVDGGALPPQYQHVLGGEGSLPGYKLFSADCGARALSVVVPRTSFDDDDDPAQSAHPAFGCDRALLFQAEYRGRFGFEIDFDPASDDEEWDGEWDWYPAFDLTPSWAAFVDVGQGWSATDDAFDTGTFADLGVGFFIGDLGFYWALPLEGDGRRANFFVRLQRRF